MFLLLCILLDLCRTIAVMPCIRFDPLYFVVDVEEGLGYDSTGTEDEKEEQLLTGTEDEKGVQLLTGTEDEKKEQLLTGTEDEKKEQLLTGTEDEREEQLLFG